MGDKNYYNTILSQVFSPCGNYLVVGDIYGTISVFNLKRIVNPETSIHKDEREPVNVFEVQKNIQINSLLVLEKFLLVGSVGEIQAYNWSSIKNQDVTSAWTILIPNSKDTFEKVDINCMLYNDKNNYVYAGCSDNNIYAIDIDTGKIMHPLKSHTNYIHSLAQWGEEFVSGGEDGLVNIWDIRTKNPVHILEPWKNSKVQRTELGKWIGALAINEDWLICGGGPRLSLWHYRTLNISTVFPLSDSGIHVAQFYEDKVLAGGRCKFFYQMNLNGEVISEIPTSSISTYNAIYQKQPFETLCLSGSSCNIDICSNLNYRDQVFALNIYN